MRAAFLMLISVSFALAQVTVSTNPVPQSVMQLSLKRAVEIALTPEGSPKVALAMESVKQAQEQTRQAKSAFLPTVDGSIQERSETVNLRTFGINFPTVPGFVIPSFVGPFSVFDARASAQQSIFSFSDIRKYQASRAAAVATASDLNTTRNQVSDQVARAYLACLRADAALETAQANVDLSNALLKLSNRQKEAGTGTGIEITRAQVQLANDQQRLIVADNDRRKAVLQLLRAMGLNLDSDVAFTDKLAFTAVDVATLEASLEEARKQRAELKAQQQRERVAQSQLRLGERGAVAVGVGVRRLRRDRAGAGQLARDPRSRHHRQGARLRRVPQGRAAGGEPLAISAGENPHARPGAAD